MPFQLRYADTGILFFLTLGLLKGILPFASATPRRRSSFSPSCGAAGNRDYHGHCAGRGVGRAVRSDQLACLGAADPDHFQHHPVLPSAADRHADAGESRRATCSVGEPVAARTGNRILSDCDPGDHDCTGDRRDCRNCRSRPARPGSPGDCRAATRGDGDQPDNIVERRNNPTARARRRLAGDRVGVGGPAGGAGGADGDLQPTPARGFELARI
jgi:hypothetical protein